MNHSTHIVVAVFSFATGAALLQPISADTDVRHVIARADTVDAPIVAVASQLAEYAGRYASDEGDAFIIDDEGDFLSIELPEAWGGVTLRLQAQSAREFSAEGAVKVRFEVGSDGRAAGISLEGEHAAVAATKVFARGIVTIHDVTFPDAASARCASELACS